MPSASVSQRSPCCARAAFGLALLLGVLPNVLLAQQDQADRPGLANAQARAAQGAIPRRPRCRQQSVQRDFSRSPNSSAAASGSRTGRSAMLAS